MSALVVALGGTAVALPGSKTVDENDLAKNVVDSKAIAKEAVKGADIKADAVKGKQLADAAVDAAKVADGTIGAAEIADNAIGGGEIADNAIGAAEIADNAAGSAEIATAAVGAEEIADLEPPKTVTAFGNGGQNDCIWAPSAVAAFGPVGFYKDPFGIVHLTGVANATDGPGGDGVCDDTADGRVLTLPPGYQPDTTEAQGTGDPVLIAPDEGATIGPDTLPPGTVFASPTVGVAALDGITFRAAGAGTSSKAAKPAALPPLAELLDLLGR